MASNVVMNQSNDIEPMIDSAACLAEANVYIPDQMDIFSSSLCPLPTQQADWIRSAHAVWAKDSARSASWNASLWFTCSTLKRLSIPGAAETGEPCDLTCANAAELASLSARLAQQSRAIVLPRVPAASPSIDALRRAFGGRGLVVIRKALGTPYVDLDASWAEPQLKFNTGRRSDFRRAERHAEKLGALTFEVHEKLSRDELERLLDEAYGVEARSWKGRNGSALAQDGRLGPFFRHYAHAAMNAGLLRLALMRVGGVAIGMQIAVQWQQRLWLLKIGYDPAYARCSPGNLLMLHTLGYAARQGLRSYEFLGSPAPWTAQWTTTLRPYSHVSIYPASVPGAVALAQDAARIARLRLLKWLDRRQDKSGT